jgi:hypothetical protein
MNEILSSRKQENLNIIIRMRGSGMFNRIPLFEMDIDSCLE